MKSDRTGNYSEILLGRPFLSTADVKIGVRSGLLTLECNGEVVKYNVYKAMRYPEDIESVNFVDMFDPVIHEFVETDFVDKSCREYDDSDNEFREFEPNYLVNSVLFKELFTPPKSKLLPSILQAPDIELKPPPEHLTKGYTLSAKISKLKKIRKYAYVNNPTYKKETKRLHVRRISLKEILSWIKRKKRRKLRYL
ncbi:hypothetical protein V6N13_056161 [Hibiscus sabdariffa]